MISGPSYTTKWTATGNNKTITAAGPTGQWIAQKENITVVGVKKAVRVEGTTQTDGPIIVPVGTSVSFKALRDPGDAMVEQTGPFPADWPKWSFKKSTDMNDQQLESQTGNRQISFSRTEPGEYTIKAQCGTSSGTFTVTFVGVEKVIVDGATPEDEGPYYLCDCPSASLTLRALPNLSGASFPEGQPIWALKRWFPELSQWSTVDTGSGEIFVVDPSEPGTYQAIATCGTSSDPFDVIVQKKSTVGMVVDTQAVEGGVDNISIRFVRFGGDQSRKLTVSFTTNFSTASPDDLVDGDGKTALLRGDIEIPAGQSSATITLEAVAEDPMNPAYPGPEGIEQFVVSIDSNCCYGLVPNDTRVETKDAQEAYWGARFFILGCTDLYIIGADDDPVDDPIPAGNPGIHITDVQQGGLGDCYALVAMQAMLRECWQVIRDRIYDHHNGTYTVTLWNGSKWVEYTVDGGLVRGPNGANLTGDVNAADCAEIWPIVLEAAFAQHLGSYEALGSGGFPTTLYDALTGGNSPAAVSTSGMTDDDIFQKITNALGQGKQVSLGTKKPMASSILELPDPDLVEGHAYLVVEVDENYVTLANPWGGAGSGANVDVPIDILADAIDGIFVLSNISCPP